MFRRRTTTQPTAADKALIRWAVADICETLADRTGRPAKSFIPLAAERVADSLRATRPDLLPAMGELTPSPSRAGPAPERQDAMPAPFNAEEEFFFFVFPNEDMERVSCTERDAWMHWNRTYPSAVRLTDVNGSVMALRDTD